MLFKLISVSGGTLSVTTLCFRRLPPTLFITTDSVSPGGEPLPNGACGFRTPGLPRGNGAAAAQACVNMSGSVAFAEKNFTKSMFNYFRAIANAYGAKSVYTPAAGASTTTRRCSGLSSATAVPRCGGLACRGGGASSRRTGPLDGPEATVAKGDNRYSVGSSVRSVASSELSSDVMMSSACGDTCRE